ncbi:hypothetical protein ACWCXC_15915 [Streptomyces sp. NPDC001515]
MEEAVSDGAASPRDLAFLRDRTLVNEGRKQIYGTQIAGVKDGSPVPWPCEDPERKARLDGLHRAKIRLADEVLVVGDYIGDSTRAEIAYARSLGRPVRFTHPDVDPGGELGDGR